MDLLPLTANLDLDAFWAENAACFGFTPDKPRCPVSFSPDDHWLFELLHVTSTIRYYFDKPYRDDLHRQANALLRQTVGRAYFDEDTFANSCKRIENLFGCEFEYTEGGTPWLMPVTDDPDEFSRVLDRAEQTDLRAWAFPEPFLAEWEQRKQEGRALPQLGTGSRGPATIMTSVLKPETLFYWTVDHPELLRRFSDLLAERMVAFNQILREFSGNTTPGWWITDDNCALFNPRLYRTYCAPVLHAVLEAMAPVDASASNDVPASSDAKAPQPVQRYQHSDSAMGHLLDQQYALGIREVNYGPTVDAGLIRAKMPEAWIRGQLPPMLLRNGTPEEIRQWVVEDFRKAGASGGLEITTAGSLPAGAGPDRMRWLMQVVQDCCRYQN